MFTVLYYRSDGKFGYLKIKRVLDLPDRGIHLMDRKLFAHYIQKVFCSPTDNDFAPLFIRKHHRVVDHVAPGAGYSRNKEYIFAAFFDVGQGQDFRVLLHGSVLVHISGDEWHKLEEYAVIDKKGHGVRVGSFLGCQIPLFSKNTPLSTRRAMAFVSGLFWVARYPSDAR